MEFQPPVTANVFAPSECPAATDSIVPELKAESAWNENGVQNRDTL
jgi:hypothetical protein